MRKIVEQLSLDFGHDDYVKNSQYYIEARGILEFTNRYGGTYQTSSLKEGVYWMFAIRTNAIDFIVIRDGISLFQAEEYVDALPVGIK